MIRDTYKELFTNKEKVTALVRSILETGDATLPNFLDDDTWSKLKSLAETRTIGNTKNDALHGTIAHELVMSDEIFQFCDLIHKTRCEIEGKKYVPLARDKQWVGFPYKDARNGAETRQTDYHYDGAYINFIIPLMMPADTHKSGGYLIIFPNIRTKYPAIISKLISRLLRHFEWFRNLYGYKTIHYTIGSLHMFFGDVSFHGVPPIKEGERMVMTINSHW
jgi:hypothetical protein